jgi:hypothetical protein
MQSAGEWSRAVLAVHAGFGSACEVAESRFAIRSSRAEFRNCTIDSVTPLAPAGFRLRLSARSTTVSVASGLPWCHHMAVLFLALFPILLMYRPRWAFAAIALAIVLLYRSRVKTATTNARRRVEEEIYSSDI